MNLYNESDEISILCAPNWDFFDRSLEKVVSISAGIASATFTNICQNAVSFDSRVWLGDNKSQVIDYFRWRQADATRCALNGWCYWTLRKAGKTVRQATSMLEGKSVAFKNDLLFEYGINFNADLGGEKSESYRCYLLVLAMQHAIKGSLARA